MKRKNKIIAIIVGVILVMQITGCGSDNNTWAGYEADAANGLRVKEVKFTDAQGKKSYVRYDVEGNITESRIYCYGYESFFEKAFGIQVPFEYEPESFMMEMVQNDSLARVNKDNWEKRSSNRTIYSFEDEHGFDIYIYLADGRIVEHQYAMNREWGKEWHSIEYTYDDKRRLVKEEERHDIDGVDVDRIKEYTYEGDSIYLKRVSSKTFYNNHSHAESITLYKYNYDSSDNIIRVEKYEENIDYSNGERETGGKLTQVWEYEYDENGNVYESCSGLTGGRTVTQYDEDGNIIEHCGYETFGSEEYMTSKKEYFQNQQGDYQVREITYRYEANADYSIVNLIGISEGSWKQFYPEFYDKGYDEVNDCWAVTYYTQEEVDKYMHDKEFQRVN